MLDLGRKVLYNICERVFFTPARSYNAYEREFDMNNPIKNILSALAVVAVLFTPSYVAIANYVTAQNAPVEKASVSKLVITDPAGNEFDLDSDDARSAATIASFVELNDHSVEQTSLPEPLVGTDYFEFRFFTYDRESVYRYYFTSDPSEAYFVDNGGKAYRITEADASAFLSTEYARCLYDTTTFPTLTVSGEAINPDTASWVYETYSGDYVPLGGISLGTAPEKVHMMKGAFALNFDIEPDFCTVTISDKGNVVYSDLYANIANASLEGKTIDVTVEAKWYETEDKARYGEAVYKFKAKILLPAVFYLGETEIEPGEFVVITAKNVDDPSGITFASEPDIGFTPKFYTDGDYSRALIPIGMDFTGESVKMTFSYGEVTQDVILDITPKEFGSSSFDADASVVAQSRSEAALKAFHDATDSLLTSSSETPLWEGAFIEALDQSLFDSKAAFIKRGFGRYVKIAATSETYRNDGVDYYVANGKQVLAANNGTVVFAGYLDYSGYTVIIDHGLGLKTWYYNMDATNVQVGQSVTKGESIGVSGNTGFTSNSGVHVTTTVFNVPVCPYSLWENGVVME